MIRYSEIPSGHGKLPHHAVILVLKDMTVVHERRRRGWLVESDQEFDWLFHKDRVSGPLVEQIGPAAIPTQDIEMHTMDVT